VNLQTALAQGNVLSLSGGLQWIGFNRNVQNANAPVYQPQYPTYQPPYQAPNTPVYQSPYPIYRAPN
jgi:hypothetical protein